MTSITSKEREEHPTHLEPSELGTKEYWESFYNSSLKYLASKRKPGQASQEGSEDDEDADNGSDGDDNDEDDPGTSWFSEYKAPEKVLRFLTSDTFPLAPCNTNPKSSGNKPTSLSSPSAHKGQPSILDLGTGNGSMLTLLRHEGGFTGPMVGVDYSPKSIELARQLASHSSSSSSAEKICFEVWDILAALEASHGSLPDWFPAESGGFDIVLDKGTFDAVSLSAEEIGSDGTDGEQDGAKSSSPRVQRRICERYPPAAIQLVRPGGFLVVTSCNWTEDELVKWFTTTATRPQKQTSELVVWDRIAYTKFRFGGQEGQGVCTVCFQRREAEEG